MKTLKDFITDFGNAEFACGEFDDEELSLDKSIKEYEKLLRESDRAEKALVDFIEENNNK